MKTQSFGRHRSMHTSQRYDFVRCPFSCLPSLQDYRDNRENGDERDSPKRAFPIAGFDALEIKFSEWPGPSKDPDSAGRHWWKLTCKSGEVNDFYWMEDKARGYPDGSGNYWFSVHHAPSGTKIEGFSQQREKEDRAIYQYYAQYDECGPIKEWMEEKDRNYVARLNLEKQSEQSKAVAQRALEEKRQQALEAKRLRAAEEKRLKEDSEKQSAQLKQLQKATLDAEKAQLLAAAEKKALEEERLRSEQERRQSKKRKRQYSEAEQTLAYSDFEFTREIAEGSFGKVWLGKWMGAPVAIKKPHSNEGGEAMSALNSFYLQSLRDEASMMSKLNHPNVVKFYGIVVKPEFCIVMELMTKGTLCNLLESPKRLDWSSRHSIAVDVAHGLRYLHRANVLHRDLKSPNILLDNDYRAKLSDYGTSKYGASYSTQSLYSPFWLAPELLLLMVDRNSKATVVYTQACDVYSFAIVLWELASRKEPKYIPPQRLMTGGRQEIPADTPASMTSLIRHCWAQKPEERPAMDAVVEKMHANSVETNDYMAGSISPIIIQGESYGRNSASSSSLHSSSSSSFSSGSGFFQTLSAPSVFDEEEPLPEEPPEELVIAQAKHGYQAKNQNQLSFNKGDIIVVLEQQGNWWVCELDGRKGRAPRNYLSIIPQQSQEIDPSSPGCRATSLS